MSEKTFLVLGESQFGKSSFINMISGENSQRVGTGDGRPCTSQITVVPFTDVLGISQTGAKLCCLDVPGFNDDSFGISNKQILDNIRSALTEKEYFQLDALLLFQSAAMSALQLTKLFYIVESLFGPTFVRSCVIIATQFDILSEKTLLKRRETIERFAEQKNVPVVWWMNEYGEAIPFDRKQQQTNDLKRALARVQIYNMTDMHEFEQRIQVRAQELMQLDRCNVTARQIEVPYEETVEYEIDENYQDPVIKQRYNESEVMEKARYLQSLPENKEKVTEYVKTKVKKCSDQEEKGWLSCLRRKKEEYEEKSIPQVKYKDKDLEIFAKPLRNEKIVVCEEKIRKVKKSRVERRVKTLTENVVLRDWKDYRSQAVKDLIRANS